MVCLGGRRCLQLGGGIVSRMSEHAGWLLLHGTPLTPQIWNGVVDYLRGYGPVQCPEITPTAGSRDAQAALAAQLAAAL